MRLITATDLAHICAGKWHCQTGTNVPQASDIGPDVVFDSRQVTPGALFVALPGERVDGHDFVAAARQKGASAALVTHPVDDPLPQLVVDDGVSALMCLARHIHQLETARGLRTVGITGSSGKTTTKDLLAQLMESNAPTVSPAGSLNNELGMPITTLKIGKDTGFFVCEMGAQHVGDISVLCNIAQPQIGVVLNVGHAHLGEFGSVAQIATAKSELVQSLPANGFAVLNMDDPMVWNMRTQTQAQVVATTVAGQPDYPNAVWASDLKSDAQGCFAFTMQVQGAPKTGTDNKAIVQLKMPGLHVVQDALQAAAVALCWGLPLTQVAAILSNALPRSKWRMALGHLPNGALLINDAYNANPDSVRAALQTLPDLLKNRRLTHPTARCWVVLADMLELGEDSEKLHEQAGLQAAQVADEVLAIGQFAPSVIKGAGFGQVVSDVDTLQDMLQTNVEAADVVLLKGSNSTKLGALGETLATTGGAAC